MSAVGATFKVARGQERSDWPTDFTNPPVPVKDCRCATLSAAGDLQGRPHAVKKWPSHDMPSRDGFPMQEGRLLVMKSTKLMLLGALIMLLGVGLMLGMTQFVAMQVGIAVSLASNFAYAGVGVVLLGFVVGVAGFFAKN